ncbi:hypothetical protein J6590_003783 [Homalodisca vitripennis]|nr:hypothetical protein J6590_003783 [Homalodisca vitripennis]
MAISGKRLFAGRNPHNDRSYAGLGMIAGNLGPPGPDSTARRLPLLSEPIPIVPVHKLVEVHRSGMLAGCPAAADSRTVTSLGRFPIIRLCRIPAGPFPVPVVGTFNCDHSRPSAPACGSAFFVPMESELG